MSKNFKCIIIACCLFVSGSAFAEIGTSGAKECTFKQSPSGSFDCSFEGIYCPGETYLCTGYSAGTPKVVPAGQCGRCDYGSLSAGTFGFKQFLKK